MAPPEGEGANSGQRASLQPCHSGNLGRLQSSPRGGRQHRAGRRLSCGSCRTVDVTARWAISVRTQCASAVFPAPLGALSVGMSEAEPRRVAATGPRSRRCLRGGGGCSEKYCKCVAAPREAQGPTRARSPHSLRSRRSRDSARGLGARLGRETAQGRVGKNQASARAWAMR